MRFSSSFIYLILYLGFAAAVAIKGMPSKIINILPSKVDHVATGHTGKSVRDVEDPADDIPDIASEAESQAAKLVDNKGLANSASRAFNNSSSNALSKADGKGMRVSLQSE